MEWLNLWPWVLPVLMVAATGINLWQAWRQVMVVKRYYDLLDLEREIMFHAWNMRYWPHVMMEARRLRMQLQAEDLSDKR